MKNIPIIIFILLFSFILLHSIYLRATCNRLVEGLESGSADMTMDERFKKLEDRVNKMQDEIVKAEKANQENAETLKSLKNKK